MQYPPIENITKTASVWKVKSAAVKQKRHCFITACYVLRRNEVNSHFQNGYDSVCLYSDAPYSSPFIKKKNTPLNNRVAKSMTSCLCAQVGEQPINNFLL